MYGNHGYGGAEYGGLKSTITRAAVALVLKYNVCLLIQKTLTILYRIFAWKPQEDGTKSYISQE